MALHPEIYLPEVKNLELIAQQLVKGYIIGKHKSPNHGFAVEFAEHKQYNMGDPLRHVDWKLFAKSKRMYSKKYEQETNMRAHIAIDLSSSMTFSQNEQQLSKLDYALIASSAFLYILQKQVDAVSLTYFDSQIQDFFPARSNTRHFQNLKNSLENNIGLSPKESKTDIPAALEFLASRSYKNGMMILFTDLISEDLLGSKFMDEIQKLKFQNHEILIFHLLDSDKELYLNYENRPYQFIDVETGQSVVTNPQSIAKEYTENKQKELGKIADELRKHRVDYIPVDIQQSFQQVLGPFFSKRK